MNILRLRIRPDAPIDLHAPLRQAPSVVTVRSSVAVSANAATLQADAQPGATAAAHGPAAGTESRPAAA